MDAVHVEREMMHKSVHLKQYLFPVILGIAYFAVLSVLGVSRHLAFSTNAWDLGGIDQGFWTTVNKGLLFRGSMDLYWNPGGSYFGVHFSPFLFLLLPFYASFQSVVTLIVMQSLAIGLSVIPLYLIIKDEMNDRFAKIFSVGYLTYLPLVAANLYDFHVEAFFPLFFLLSIYSYKKSRYCLYIAFTILALSIIEIVPALIVSLLSISLLLRRNWHLFGEELKSCKPEVVAPIVSLLISAIWLIAGEKVILYFNPNQSFGQIRTLTLMPVNEKAFYLLVLLLPVAFLSILSPLNFLPAAGWIGPSLIVVTPSAYWTAIGFQYPAFICASIFLSAAIGFRNLSKKLRHALSPKILVLVLILCFLATIMLNSNQFTYGRLSPSELFPDDHDILIQKVVDLIPPNASVAAQPDIFPHVSNRLEAYPFYVSGVEYIIVDISRGWYKSPLPPKDEFIGGIELIDEALPKLQGSYEVVTAVDNIILYRKGYSGPIRTITSNGLMANFSVNCEVEFKSVYTKLDFSWYWPLDSPAPNLKNGMYDAIFTGFVRIQDDGEYKFRALGGGAIQVFIDGKKILDVFAQGPDGQISLSKGLHEICVVFKNYPNLYGLHLYWKTPEGDWEILPERSLFLSDT
jgi:uncharacterized membrane protein